MKKLCLGLFPFAKRFRKNLSQRSPSRRCLRLRLERLEDRLAPATLAIVGTTLQYAQSSGIDHVLAENTIPGGYSFTDNENFTSLPAGWTGTGTTTASGPFSGTDVLI